MKDFDIILNMLTQANIDFRVEEIEGEHSGLVIPSPSPEFYSTGVCYSFNEDGSLFSIHAYEPDEDEM